MKPRLRCKLFFDTRMPQERLRHLWEVLTVLNPTHTYGRLYLRLNIYILASPSLQYCENTLLCFCPRVTASTSAGQGLGGGACVGIWSFQVGRAVVRVELPYKEWNIEKNPGQLPALATTNRSFYQHRLKPEGCQVDSLPGKILINKTKT